jgi:WD40 repeat protein
MMKENTVSACLNVNPAKFAGVSDGGFIHVVDVARQEVMWQKVPHGSEVPDGPWTVGFNDACFSPDSELIYVAGNVGLFCFDVQTGRILSQWPVAGRCIGVAASPDGRLVAGGAGGNGLVYIFDARTGSLRRTIGTGQHTIYGLTFSPDSTLLATSGVMRTGVKIWKMPSPALENQPVGK